MGKLHLLMVDHSQRALKITVTQSNEYLRFKPRNSLASVAVSRFAKIHTGTAAAGYGQAGRRSTWWWAGERGSRRAAGWSTTLGTGGEGGAETATSCRGCGPTYTTTATSVPRRRRRERERAGAGGDARSGAAAAASTGMMFARPLAGFEWGGARRPARRISPHAAPSPAARGAGLLLLRACPARATLSLQLVGYGYRWVLSVPCLTLSSLGATSAGCASRPWTPPFTLITGCCRPEPYLLSIVLRLLMDYRPAWATRSTCFVSTFTPATPHQTRRVPLRARTQPLPLNFFNVKRVKRVVPNDQRNWWWDF